MKRTFTIFCLILAFATLHAGTTSAEQKKSPKAKKTQVVIIGTIHSAHHKNPKYSPDVLKEIILSLKPDAILIELPLSLVEPDGRPIKKIRGKNSDCPETWAADQAASELGVKQIPFDRPDRQKNFRKTKYFEKEKKADKLGKKCGECILQNEPNSLNIKIAQLKGYAGQAEGALFRNAGPEVINSEAHDSIIRIKKSLWYEIIPEIFKEYPECKEVFEYDHFFRDQWNIRNKIMADNIIKAAGKYQQKRLVVVTGATHRYILRDLLKNENGIELKEYWELIEPEKQKGKQVDNKKRVK